MQNEGQGLVQSWSVSDKGWNETRPIQGPDTVRRHLSAAA